MKVVGFGVEVTGAVGSHKQVSVPVCVIAEKSSVSFVEVSVVKIVVVRN